HVTRRGQSKRHNHLRMDDFKLALQIWRATGNFIRRRYAIPRWPAFDDIGDIYLLAGQPHAGNHFCQKLARAPYKRSTRAIFGFTRPLADKEEPSLRIAFTENSLRTLLT